MRASRALAVTAAAFAAIGLATPIAFANPPGENVPSNVAVEPYSVHPGATMNVSASGCRNGGTVRSDYNFPTADLSRATGVAHVRINNNARPGPATLSVECNGNPIIATHRFTILPGNGAQGGLGGSIGPSATETAIGAGLVGAAALGAGAHVIRRRRPLSGRV